MAKKSRRVQKSNQKVHVGKGRAGTDSSALKVMGSDGVKTSRDFACMMSALMSDIISGRLTPSVGNAVCNAGGKLLKVVEMQYKYGNRSKDGNRTLQLARG